MEGIKKILITVLAVMLVSVKRRLPRARRFSSGITTLTLAGIVLLVAAGSASAATEITSCNFDADDDGEYYYLNDSLTCNSGETGVNIKAANVIIDGKNHSITGNVDVDICLGGGGGESTPSRIAGIVNGAGGIGRGHSNVTVKNLEIKSFCTGISVLGYPGYIRDITIDNCTIHDNGRHTAVNPGYPAQHGIHLSYLKNSTISNCTIYDTHGHEDYCTAAGNGIYGYGGGWGANNLTIHNNTLYNNNQSGMFLKYMMQNCTITNNTAYGNGWGSNVESAGINLRCIHTSFNIVEYNNCTGNDGAGFNIGGQYNIVRYNIANDSTRDGIVLPRSDGGSNNNSMYNNTVCKNRGNGINIVDRPGNTIYNNTFCKNVLKDINDRSDDTVGDSNTCNSAFGYSDLTNPQPYCTYRCLDRDGPDLEIKELDVAWVEGKGESYNITYKVCNSGNDGANASVTAIYNNSSQQPLLVACPEALAAFTCSDPVTVGPFNIGTGAIDDITVCADIHNGTNEINEHNNCTEDRFGGPDLILYDFEPAIWVDQSYKRYNLSYTIKNVGDSASPATRVNISELSDEKWWCIDGDVPALNPGQNWSNEVGPFVMGGTSDHLQAFVNDIPAFEENVWGDMHSQYERFVAGHGWPCECCICGDVNGDTHTNSLDGKIVAGAVPGVSITTCKWAADVNCNVQTNSLDGKIIAGAVPGASKNCCAPGHV